MHIQWFPGHMTKSIRMMEEQIKLVDSVVYVLDARCIAACFNPKFDAMIKNKKVLYVINKCDLVGEQDLKNWLKYFAVKGLSVIAADSTTGKYTKKIIEKLKEINKTVLDKYRQKGVNKIIRAMVVGVPNSGKSTLVNSLCGNKRAVTGNRPGVTRGRQWVSLGGNLELLDTPGTLWHAFDNQTHALHLAMAGSISEDVLNLEELAAEIIKFIRYTQKGALETRYRINIADESEHEILEKIAKNRGFIQNGGITDPVRAAKAVIDDFRKTKLGLLMMEKAEDEASD